MASISPTDSGRTVIQSDFSSRPLPASIGIIRTKAPLTGENKIIYTLSKVIHAAGRCIQAVGTFLNGTVSWAGRTIAHVVGSIIKAPFAIVGGVLKWVGNSEVKQYEIKMHSADATQRLKEVIQNTRVINTLIISFSEKVVEINEETLALLLQLGRNVKTLELRNVSFDALSPLKANWLVPLPTAALDGESDESTETTQAPPTTHALSRKPQIARIFISETVDSRLAKQIEAVSEAAKWVEFSAIERLASPDEDVNMPADVTFDRYSVQVCTTQDLSSTRGKQRARLVNASQELLADAIKTYSSRYQS